MDAITIRMDENKKLGSIIRDMRTAAKLTQNRLEYRTHLAENTISKYENNKINVSIWRFQEIMDALGYAAEIRICWEREPGGGREAETVDTDALGAVIYRERRRKRITQRELGGLSEATPTMISNYENSNTSISLPRFVKIMGALGYRVELAIHKKHT